ncbi:MAG: hypothetical protein Q8Q20_02670 [bacterium]|nr:hypothetical protein [bacterium]
MFVLRVVTKLVFVLKPNGIKLIPEGTIGWKLCSIRAACGPNTITQFQCAIRGCKHLAPASEMYNISRDELDGDVAVLCSHHAEMMRRHGRRVFSLLETFQHVTAGYVVYSLLSPSEVRTLGMSYDDEGTRESVSDF